MSSNKISWDESGNLNVNLGKDGTKIQLGNSISIDNDDLGLKFEVNESDSGGKEDKLMNLKTLIPSVNGYYLKIQRKDEVREISRLTWSKFVSLKDTNDEGIYNANGEYFNQTYIHFPPGKIEGHKYPEIDPDYDDILKKYIIDYPENWKSTINVSGRPVLLIHPLTKNSNTYQKIQLHLQFKLGDLENDSDGNIEEPTKDHGILNINEIFSQISIDYIFSEYISYVMNDEETQMKDYVRPRYQKIMKVIPSLFPTNDSQIASRRSEFFADASYDSIYPGSIVSIMIRAYYTGSKKDIFIAIDREDVSDMSIFQQEFIFNNPEGYVNMNGRIEDSTKNKKTSSETGNDEKVYGN